MQICDISNYTKYLALFCTNQKIKDDKKPCDMMDQNIFSSSGQKKENFEWKKLSICKVLFSNPRQNGLKQ